MTEAASGPEALGGLEEGKYELVLLDMRMPGMTGLDVLKQLRDKQGEVTRDIDDRTWLA